MNRALIVDALNLAAKADRAQTAVRRACHRARPHVGDRPREYACTRSGVEGRLLGARCHRARPHVGDR